MKQENKTKTREVALPWSGGLLSAKLWMVGDQTVVGVPELGLHCYGSTQSEALFKLFATLIKYYRQLKSFPNRLTEKGRQHLYLLSQWVGHIEDRMKAPSSEGKVVSFGRR